MEVICKVTFYHLKLAEFVSILHCPPVVNSKFARSIPCSRTLSNVPDKVNLWENAVEHWTKLQFRIMNTKSNSTQLPLVIRNFCIQTHNKSASITWMRIIRIRKCTSSKCNVSLCLGFQKMNIFLHLNLSHINFCRHSSLKTVYHMACIGSPN